MNKTGHSVRHVYNKQPLQRTVELGLCVLTA